jgi:hypothetical protein
LNASKQQIQERQWDVDWTAYQSHTDAAEKFVAQGSVTDALREYCQVVQLLAETVQQQRPKGEVFQPLWDRR